MLFVTLCSKNHEPHRNTHMALQFQSYSFYSNQTTVQPNYLTLCVLEVLSWKYSIKNVSLKTNTHTKTMLLMQEALKALVAFPYFCSFHTPFTLFYAFPLVLCFFSHLHLPCAVSCRQKQPEKFYNQEISAAAVFFFQHAATCSSLSPLTCTHMYMHSIQIWPIAKSHNYVKTIETIF